MSKESDARIDELARQLAAAIARIAAIEPMRYRREGLQLVAVPKITRLAGESDAEFCRRATARWLTEQQGDPDGLAEGRGTEK